ncbi:MAG TPA: endo alpha-1,4 polygalactosaminidase [Kofleriaceae bacterium]|nr:endo alpha-1,4 polygalactosaminidase [Kofleriaceae bacterium]
MFAGAVLSCTAPRAIWRPAPGTSWQWQLTGTIETSLQVAMYDVDLFTAPNSALHALARRGVKIICYFSAGTYEPDRPDVGALPRAVIGKRVAGWPDERWLDIREPSVRALMRARIDRAAKRGCDGVEPDNVDGYTNDTGFPLTAADQRAFAVFIAAEAHARRLSVGLKNDLDQVPDLVAHFDWALDEECLEYDECDALAPFVAAHKAVFHVEYGDKATAARVCSAVRARGFDTLIKHRSLDAFRIACASSTR